MAMTPEEIAAWMRGKGVAEGVINDEATDDLTRYGDDIGGVLDASLGSWMERSKENPQPDGGVSLGQWASPTPYRRFEEQFAAPTRSTDLDAKWDQSFAWDPNTNANSTGYQFRQAEAAKALERSAAARGNLLTGGTAGALVDRATGVAAQYENDDYNRALGTYQTNFNTFSGDLQRRQNAYNDQYAQAADAYKTKADIWDRNENGVYSTSRQNLLDQYGFMDRDRSFGESQRQFDLGFGRTLDRDQVSDLQWLGDRGYGAAGGISNAGQGYANQASDLYTNQGNANAAATVTSGSNWSNLANNLAQWAQPYLGRGVGERSTYDPTNYSRQGYSVGM